MINLPLISYKCPAWIIILFLFYFELMRFRILILVFIIGLVLLQSCRSTKFVPDGEYLLSSTSVKTDAKGISNWEAETYIRQKPNFRTFAIFKLPLTIYNLSGRDSTKWVNRTLRNAGEPPVIYDNTMIERSVIDLKRMMTNKGYLDAEVVPRITLNKKKAKIEYRIIAGQPYEINNYVISVADSVVDTRIMPISPILKGRVSMFPSFKLDSILSNNTLVKKGNLFDLDMLDLERDRITSVFRRTGYYAFNKEHIGFVADTTLGKHKVDLDLSIYPFAQRGANDQVTESSHMQYVIDSVHLYIDFDPLKDGDISKYEKSGEYTKDGYKIFFGPRGEYIKPYVLLENCYIRPGSLYNENATAMTYSAMSQLQILKNVNITYTPFVENDTTKLHCRITCVPDKRQGISAEVEGTNSGSFLGIEGALGYMHRNIFRGSEPLNLRLHAAYEAITPSFTSFSDNYFEVGGEASITFPRFMFPFISRDFRRRLNASTNFTSDYTFQRRPGFFTRTVLSTGVKYIWQDRRSASIRHVFDLVEISYIHIPSLDGAFASKLSDAARRYSFEDQFIMSAGYTFSKSSVSNLSRRSPLSYSFRASLESAGNLLALAAKLTNAEADTLGSKKIFGTTFAQYLRGTVDYSQTIRIDDKNSIAWRVGGGLAYPYGNFKQIPIQKRFFAGGANSVRGWGVRELGPGSFYPKDDDRDNFYFHSGDIRFDANVEYRSKIFWIIELGAFIDAGNIWTLKEYKDQENGSFKLDRFYKEIALAWGLGIRLDFDFVLIRLDAGWKAYDPSGNPETTKWPIKDPLKFKKNTAIHIAVGYPF